MLATTTSLYATLAGGQQTLTLAASNGTAPYTYHLFSGPTSGASLTGLPNSSGSIQYTPVGSAAYIDTFVYYVTDNLGVQSANTTVTVYVDTAPTVTTPVHVSVPENSANNHITVQGTDPLSEHLTFPSSITTNNGVVITINSSTATSATYLYTPINSSIAPDSFTFQATNPSGLTSNTGTVNITIIPGDIPVVNSASGNTITNVPIYINFSGSDPISSSIIFSIVSLPAHGTIASVVATGDFTAQAFYTPHAGYSGSDSFTFEAYNGVAYSAPATATITIVPVPDENRFNTFVSDAITKYSGT